MGLMASALLSIVSRSSHSSHTTRHYVAARGNCQRFTRFAYCELDPQGGIHIVEPGPPPSKDKVLGSSADLRSQEEKDGGQLMSKNQVSTVNGMQRYLDCRTRREDRHHDREPTASQHSHSPSSGPYSKGTRMSRSERCHEKSKATDAPPEQMKAADAPPEQAKAADVPTEQMEAAKTPVDLSDLSSQIIDCFVPDDEYFAEMLPNQPVAGPSGTMHDELPFSDAMEMTAEGGTYEFSEVGADESMEPGNSAEDAA